MIIEINTLTLSQRKKYKQCTVCFKIKILDDYWKRKTQGKFGRYAYCKECACKMY